MKVYQLQEPLLFIVEAAAVALSFGSSTIANQLWVVGTAVSETLPTAAGGTGAIVLFTVAYTSNRRSVHSRREVISRESVSCVHF